LITKVQVALNHTDDAVLLVEALSNLKERTNLETLFTEGGYGSPDADQTLQKNLMEQIQTSIRGRAPSSEKLNMADFEIKQTESGKPTQITCPQQQIWRFTLAARRKTTLLTLKQPSVRSVLSSRKELVQPKGENEDLRFHLRFSQEQANMSQRRRRSLAHQKEGRNLRAAI